MPLKPCRECGKDVSTDARACPYCGAVTPTLSAKQADSAKWLRGLIVVVCAIAFLLWAMVNGWFG